jgi:hypothetical protein
MMCEGVRQQPWTVAIPMLLLHEQTCIAIAIRLLQVLWVSKWQHANAAALLFRVHQRQPCCNCTAATSTTQLLTAVSQTTNLHIPDSQLPSTVHSLVQPMQLLLQVQSNPDCSSRCCSKDFPA